MSVTDDIKAKLDIVEIVSPYVSLQKSGRTFKANCPFHTERTPSFIVNQDRQSWRCFGACATGGDIFGFIMRAENLQFPDALRLLARRAGVELPDARERKQSDSIHSVNNAAAGFYQETLNSDAGKMGRDYLDERGVGAAAREQFKLGLSPDGWDGLIQYLRTHGFKREDALAAGLIRQDEESGRVWDFFRNRLMFPIFDRDGNVSGFGARALDDSNPKYINTAQTEAFDKRNTLYALNFARSEIRHSGTAVIVEGYMDAIAAHERGYTNVVASMGTALTESQVSQLRSLAQRFVLALDPDEAGQEATLRSLESSWHVFLNVTSRRAAANQSVLNQWTPPSLRIAALPAGLDPDALIRTDAGRWESIVADAQPLLDFVIPALVERADLNVPGSRTTIARAVGRLINGLDDNDQYDYWRKLADALGVPQQTLMASVSGGAPRRNGGRRSATPAPEEVSGSDVSSRLLERQGEESLEDFVISLLIHRPDLAENARGLSGECFHSAENRELFNALLSGPAIETLRDDLDDILVERLDRLEAVDIPEIGRTGEAALAQCSRRLEERYLRELQEETLRSDAESAEVEERVKRVNSRIKELQTMR